MSPQKVLLARQRPNTRYTAGVRRRELLLNYKKWLKTKRNRKITGEKSKRNDTGAPLPSKPSSSPGHLRGTVMSMVEVMLCINYIYLLLQLPTGHCWGIFPMDDRTFNSTCNRISRIRSFVMTAANILGKKLKSRKPVMQNSCNSVNTLLQIFTHQRQHISEKASSLEWNNTDGRK